MDNLGRASSDVLGYIAGGTAGAITADALWEKYAHSGGRKRTTPPTPDSGNKRKRQRKLSLSGDIPKMSKLTKKQLKKKSSKYKRKYKRMKKAAVKPKDADPSHAAVYANKKKRKIEPKKHHEPKVTHKFKKMVEKALQTDSVKGTVQMKYLGLGFALDGMSQDRQAVWDTVNNLQQDAGFVFGPDHFLEAANRLWANFTGAHTLAPFLSNVPTGFDPNTVKFHVIDSHSKFVYRNNSDRTLLLRIYVCKPKMKGSYNSIDPTNYIAYKQNGTSVTLNDPIVPPAFSWTDSVAGDFASRQSSNGYGAAISNSTLFLEPSTSKYWKNVWTSDFKEIKMMPGQDYEFIIQGPQDMSLDYQKFWREGIYQNVQMFTRGVLHVLIADMDTANTTSPSNNYSSRSKPKTLSGASGRTIQQFLCQERYDYFRLQMPEETLSTYYTTTATGTTPANVPLLISDYTKTARKDQYINCIAVEPATTSGVEEEMTVDNPQKVADA
jgi:hypothetical protein